MRADFSKQIKPQFLYFGSNPRLSAAENPVAATVLAGSNLILSGIFAYFSEL
jgi:hypothetical protein